VTDRWSLLATGCLPDRVRIRIRLRSQYREIGNDIVALLQAAGSASTRSVNALMTATCWEIGRRIVESEQRGRQRSEYGEALIKQLAEDLEPRFGGALGGATLREYGRSSCRCRPCRFCRHRLQNLSLFRNWLKSSLYPGRPTCVCSRFGIQCRVRFYETEGSSFWLVNSTESQVCTLTSRLCCDSYARKLFASGDEAILQTAIQGGH